MPTRVLIVTTVAVTVRAFLLPFARRCQDRGWQVDVACADVGQLREYSSFDGLHEIPWTRIGTDLPALARSLTTIRGVLKRGRYDLVHVHTPIASFLTRLAAATLPVSRRPQVVYTAHGFHFHPRGSRIKNAVFALLERLAGYWTDRLVVINREDEASARRLRLVPPERLHYMPGIGVATDDLTPEHVPDAAAQEVRRALGAQERPLLLQIAEFNPRKRHGDALAALAALRHASGDAMPILAFAGDGPLRPATEQLARTLGVSEHVRFLGHRSDIPTLIRASDVVLLVSDQEGLPRSLMEALSLEIPAIGTKIRGITELLQDGAGLLVEVGDPEGLAGAIRQMIADPDGRRAMGRRGRQLMRSQYDLRHIIALHDALYDRMMSHGRSRS